MIPVTLALTNFLPYKNPEPLDFSGIHVACLSGENGAGKSALLEAIVWALWGRARDGKRSDDELIHFGESEMRVTFTFELSGHRYQVMRQRKSGKRGQTLLELQLYDDHTESWRGMSEAGIRQTQRKINELLHIDYETFMNSAFIAQGRADEFTVKSAGERKVVLASILGLDQWTLFENLARDRVAALTEDVRVLERDISSIDSELQRRSEFDLELSDAKADLSHVNGHLRAAERDMADIEQARQALTHMRRSKKDLSARLKQGENELAEVSNELTEAQARGDHDALLLAQSTAQSELDVLDGYEADHKKLAGERANAAETSARLQGENETLIAEADPIKERIAALQRATEPICPTCGEPLDEDARGHLLLDLQVDLDTRRGRYAEQREHHQKLIKEVQGQDKRLHELEKALKQKPGLQRKVAELGSAVARAAEVDVAVLGLEKRQQRWQVRLAQDHAQLHQIELEVQEAELQLQAVDKRQQMLDRLRFDHRVAIERVGSARQKLASLEGLANRRESRKIERNRLAEQIGIYEELRVAFGKQGVPAMIIEAAVPELEASANLLLGKMTGARMSVRFDTQRELKSGVLRETLDIKISDDLGTRNYELYSGGEAFRVNFAIRIALSKLLARRAGAQLQTVVIDEGFGTQDALGRERLLEAISAIQDEFKRVLVITHIEELKEAFPTRINVVKTSVGSTLSLG